MKLLQAIVAIIFVVLGVPFFVTGMLFRIIQIGFNAGMELVDRIGDWFK